MLIRAITAAVEKPTTKNVAQKCILWHQAQFRSLACYYNFQLVLANTPLPNGQGKCFAMCMCVYVCGTVVQCSSFLPVSHSCIVVPNVACVFVGSHDSAKVFNLLFYFFFISGQTNNSKKCICGARWSGHPVVLGYPEQRFDQHYHSL